MIVDEDVEEFIQHFGKKGMHWGIRNIKNPSKREKFRVGTERFQRRVIDPQRRVAVGRGSFGDKFRVALNTPMIDLATIGLKEGARSNLEDAKLVQNKVKRGKKRFTAWAARLNRVSIADLNYNIPRAKANLRG